MIWVEITLADVIAHLPTDIKARHDEWVATYPDKSGRLAEITANTIREFRDAIKSNPANIVDPRETWLPQSAVRHVESLIIFNIAMEMGITIDSSGNSARSAADIFLRQIPFGRWNTTAGDGAMPSPRFTVPERTDFGGRALPLVASLMLFMSTAYAGWIKPGSVLYDTSLTVTFAPSAYTNVSTTLYGHLFGINSALASLPASQNVYTNVVTLSGLPAQTLFPPYIPPPQAIKGRLDIDGLLIGKPDTSDTETYIRPAYAGVNLRLVTPSRTGSPGNCGDIVLSPGLAFTGGTNGSVVITSDAKVDKKLTASGGTITPALWLSTNSYLTALDNPTSLYFVVVNPPSTNRIGP